MKANGDRCGAPGIFSERIFDDWENWMLYKPIFISMFALVIGCTDQGISIYLSSKNDGTAIAVSETSHRFLPVLNVNESISEGHLAFTIVLFDSGEVTYAPSLRVLIPFNENAASWRAGDIACKRMGQARGVIRASCTSAKDGEAFEIAFDEEKRLVEFQNPCIISDGKCQFHLVRGNGVRISHD